MQSAVIARGIPSVCLSVRPSIHHHTSRSGIQTNEDIIVRFQQLAGQSFFIILLQPTYFRLSSLVSARPTPLKLLFCPYFLTFFWPSTVEIWQHWSFWISLLHSTRSIISCLARYSATLLDVSCLLVSLTCLTGKGCDLHRLISLTFCPSICQLSVVAHFRLLVLRSGTAYQMMSPPLHPCPPSGAV